MPDGAPDNFFDTASQLCEANRLCVCVCARACVESFLVR